MKSPRFFGRRKKLSTVQAQDVSAAAIATRTNARPHRFLLRRVMGESMFPTLQPGELVIAQRVSRVKPGDVIIFRHKGIEKIKRVREVDERRYYVVGDNPNYSTDSRHFGMIYEQDVLGKVIKPKC